MYCCCLGRIWLHRVHPALFDRFQRTTIDLSLPWRFANLPNNAKLEIVTCTRKQAVTESQVSVFHFGKVKLYFSDMFIQKSLIPFFPNMNVGYDDDCQSMAPFGHDIVFCRGWR